MNIPRFKNLSQKNSGSRSGYCGFLSSLLVFYPALATGEKIAFYIFYFRF